MTIFRECEAVVRRKAAGSLPTLAQLLDLGRVEICDPGTEEALEQARCLVAYGPDAVVLAEAIAAEPVDAPGRFIRLETPDPTKLSRYFRRRPTG
ncbi:MAG TPA: hypothetical protein VMN57_05535 [Anaerolineales bacterium]|nr:hypothetical protein [Anaerolineales bacterium]